MNDIHSRNLFLYDLIKTTNLVYKVSVERKAKNTKGPKRCEVNMGQMMKLVPERYKKGFFNRSSQLVFESSVIVHVKSFFN